MVVFCCWCCTTNLLFWEPKLLVGVNTGGACGDSEAVKMALPVDIGENLFSYIATKSQFPLKRIQ